MTATTSGTGLRFELKGTMGAVDVEVGAGGAVELLRYTVRGEQPREFSGAEIISGSSEEGTRATVMLESGAADGPIVRFSVIVPPVVAGDGGPFEVTAAGLRSAQSSLFGGPRPGPQVTYEIVDLEGVVHVMASGAGDDPCSDWYASHDHTPPGPATLRVTGSCTFPTTGYEVQLRRHEPQGINPRDLLLDRIVIAPTGVIGPGSNVVEARYEEETDFEYDSVTILPDGPSIQVQEVH